MSDSKNRLSSRDKYFCNEHLKSGLKTRALRGAGATIFSQTSMFAIQIVGTIVLARILTPEDFGLVAMVTIFSYLFHNFGLRGFTEATIQSEVINHRKISTLFWIHVGLSLALTILFMLLSPFLVWFYKEPRLEAITIVVALSFVFNALYTQHLSLLARNMQFYRITGIEIMAAIVSQVVAIAMAIEGWEYWSLVARRLIPFVATAIGAWILCRWIPGLPARSTGVKSMLKFGMHTYGNFATNYFSRNLDKVLIGWRYAAHLLGHYERAYYLFVLPVNQLSHPLTNVAVAALSRLRDNLEKYRISYLKSLSVLAFIGMPLSAVLTLTAKDVLLLFLGPQWDKAGEIFTAFGPAIGITLVYGTHGWLHLSLGRANRWFRWGIIELIATSICFIIGLQFGVIGVAIAYSASFYLLIIPGLWYAARPAQIRLSSIISAMWRHYVSAFIAGLACWYILYSYDLTSQIFMDFYLFVRILVSSILCMSFYLLLSITFFGGKKSLSEFFSLLRDMVSKNE